MALSKGFCPVRGGGVVIIALFLKISARSFYLSHFKGAFIRYLQKATVSSAIYCCVCLCVCLSVRIKQLDSHCKDVC